LAAQAGRLQDVRARNLGQVREVSPRVREVLSMRLDVPLLGIKCCSHVKTGLLEPQRHPSRTAKEVDRQWTRFEGTSTGEARHETPP